MRILHLDSGSAWRGGQQQLHYLAKGLKQQGVQQHLGVRRGSPLASRAAHLNVPVTGLPLFSEFDAGSLFSLGGLIRRFRPQLIHAHDSRTLGLAVLLKSLGWGARIVAARRVAFSIRRNRWWKFKYANQTNRIIAVSHHVRDLLIREGLEPRQVEVVYDAVETVPAESASLRSSARRRLGATDEEFLIGCVGQLTPEKGQELLIRGFADLLDVYPDSRLALVGDGELRREFQELIGELGLDRRAILTGFVSDLDSLLPAFDLLVHPSLAEGLGSVLLKGMAHRVPICASRTGGIPEVVVDGETGFLFPPGSPKGLVEAVVRARGSPELARRQAERANARVLSDFSVERMVVGTCRIYSNVING
ncbi:MAG: glycosyltransferase family 4 protein [Acidobacteriota bacterium]